MVKTTYGTLPLPSNGTAVRERPSRAKLFVATLFLVGVAAMAAVAGHTTASSVASVIDMKTEYNALEAVPVNCDKTTHDYLADLPRWDPEFSTEDDFFNACYYSFRCCTTTGNGDGCYVSDQFGAMCRSCIKANSPRFVKKDCVDWLNDDTGVDTSGWTMDDLMNDAGVPKTQNMLYAVMFKNYPGGPTEENGEVDTRSCWQPRGSGDKQVIDFAEKCFEVLSWCNLLCPRDTPQTVDHVMCKHCTLFGFQDGYWDHDNWEKTLFGGEAGPKKIIRV